MTDFDAYQDARNQWARDHGEPEYVGPINRMRMRLNGIELDKPIDLEDDNDYDEDMDDD
jgi:hypothetical protein